MIIIGHCGGCHLGRLEVKIKKIDLCQSEKAYLGYYEFKNSYRILFLHQEKALQRTKLPFLTGYASVLRFASRMITILGIEVLVIAVYERSDC